MAGGTALALHLGHRYSEDFDFFTDQHFEVEVLLKSLQKLGNCQDVRQRPEMLFLRFNAISCSFIYYQYPLFDPAIPSPWGFGISSTREIGAMKIMAIGGRGRRRDFIDLYFIAKQSGIEKIWQDFQRKYIGTGYDPYHFLRALTYFVDAEPDTMPRMIEPVTWDEVKSYIESESRRIAP